MATSLDFSQLMETLRGTAGPLSSQEALALALPDVLELSADEYADGLELAISVGVLSHLPPLDLQRLLQRADEIPVRAGEVVIEQGARGRECYLVKHGSARVQRVEGADAAQELASKGPGELFGEESLISGSKRSASVIMREDGVLLRLAAEDFAALVLPCLLRPVTQAEAATMVERGACWLDIREHTLGLGSPPQSVSLPWSCFRDEYRRLDDSVSWVVRADRGGEAALAAFMLALAGYQVSHLAEVSPPIAPDLHATQVLDDVAMRAAIADSMAPGEAFIECVAVPVMDDAGASSRGTVAEDDPVRIGLEDVRAFERQRHERHLRKTLARLTAEADARVAHAVEATEQRLLAEVHKRQQQLLELRQENARLQRELLRLRGLAANAAAVWSTPQSLDII